MLLDVASASNQVQRRHWLSVLLVFLGTAVGARNCLEGSSGKHSPPTSSTGSVHIVRVLNRQPLLALELRYWIRKVCSEVEKAEMSWMKLRSEKNTKLRWINCVSDDA